MCVDLPFVPERFRIPFYEYDKLMKLACTVEHSLHVLCQQAPHLLVLQS